MTIHDREPPEVVLVANCPQCGSPLRRRRNRRTGAAFWGCAQYPTCKYSCDAIELSASAADLLRQALAERDGEHPVSAADLRRLIFKWHPDRCQGALDPGEVTVALNGLLDRIRGAA